jgi:hypothetical protein
MQLRCNCMRHTMYATCGCERMRARAPVMCPSAQRSALQHCFSQCLLETSCVTFLCKVTCCFCWSFCCEAAICWTCCDICWSLLSLEFSLEFSRDFCPSSVYFCPSSVFMQCATAQQCTCRFESITLRHISSNASLQIFTGVMTHFCWRYDPFSLELCPIVAVATS